MTFETTQIIIRYDRAREYTLSGLPLLARVILAAAGDRAPAVAVLGEWTEDYRQAVETTVTQVAPGAKITWSGHSLAHPADVIDPAADRILLITANGLFTKDLANRLLDFGRGTNLWAKTGSSHEGLWLLDKAAAIKMMQGGDVEALSVAVDDQEFYPARDEGELQQAEKWLFRRFGKSTDGFVSRYLNRPVSTWVSRRLARTPVMPNQLTLLTAAFAIAMFIVLQIGTMTSLAIGCLLYHVTSVVDGFDGEVARAKFLSTRWGASFDTGVDMATNILFIIGLTIGLSKVYGPEYMVLGGLVVTIALTSIALMSYMVWKGPKGGSFDVLQLAIRRRLGRLPLLLRGFEILNAVLKRDFFALLFGLLGIAGYAALIPWLLAAGMTAWLVAIVMAAPLVIGADPADILPDHLNSLPATKAPQITGGGAE